MGKRVVAGILAVIMAGSIITGCSQVKKEGNKISVSDNDKTASKKVELTIWAGKEDRDYIKTVSDNFIKEHKSEADITIKHEDMVEGECRSNLLGNVLKAADVYTTTDGDISAIAAGGAADPIEDAKAVKAENLEAASAAVTINSTMYGYPITADNGYFLYYNKKYLNSNDVKSLDRILQVAAKNNKKFAMDFTSGWYLYSFYGQTGLKVGLNSDGVTNYCTWNSKENSIKGVDVANALMRIGRNKGFENTADWLGGIKKGRVIACVSGIWDEAAIKKMYGRNYGAAKLPTYNCNGKKVQMATYFGYKMLGVNPYSKNKEWAHKLARYISNEENQKLRFKMRGQGPSNINAGKSDEVKKSQAVQAILKQSEYSELQRLGGNFWTPATNMGTSFANNSVKGDLQKYLDKMAAQMKASVVQ
ncbi:extracellular solute-binding protein [Eubacterium sp. MSJ-13]|uniref:extracellular solute-binding protein n=1 Tax=Eubacterium sp. MSJ-13 TaxID=2841513 RepID=UPI001C12085C|nr:extracellular solute-binding protein [Eubacterium sp. MSJ-13]MBU5478408.1 extracellular solute-binding protein [Eubacterium sp. MSJ-13]